jgi:hypothetical protein
LDESHMVLHDRELLVQHNREVCYKFNTAFDYKRSAKDDKPDRFVLLFVVTTVF